MLNCPIKNIPSTFEEPDGNPGRNFPLTSNCSSPVQPVGDFCPLLLEETPSEFILLNDGQPILIDCILSSDNPITVTASYRSCPLQIEYYVTSDFDVDTDIIVTFVNVLSTTTGPSLSYTVSTVINEGTSLAFVSLSDAVSYGDLTQTSFFVDVSATPLNPSRYTNSVNFYSIFENLTTCLIGVERNTPGFTSIDFAYCRNVIMTEQHTGNDSLYAPCSAYNN